MVTYLFHFRFADTEQYWLCYLMFFETWDQKLCSGLLLKLMTTQLFQFRFAVTELQCDPLNVTVNEIAVYLQLPALSTELTVFTQDHRCCRQALPIPGSVVPATFHK